MCRVRSFCITECTNWTNLFTQHCLWFLDWALQTRQASSRSIVAILCEMDCVDVSSVDDIEAAMHLSADEFQTKYGFVKPVPSGRPLIVYCMRGVRATQAAITFAEQFGFTRFVHLTVYIDCVVQCRWYFPFFRPNSMNVKTRAVKRLISLIALIVQ